MKFFNKIFFFFLLLFSYSIFSQNSGYKTGVSNILNAANPEDIGVRTAVQVQEDKDDPLEYGYVNDKDILWSTTVWEIIDLDQRVNYPLLYPVDTSVVGDERRPMIWWLKQEIEKFNLPVYDAENTESEGEFIERLPDERVENIFKRRIISDEGREKFKNAIAVIEERISVQYDKYNFNPYEEEISAEEKQILANDSTFNPIFPYTIKKFTGYKELTDEVFSYAQFLGFTSADGPVRVVQPQGIPEELSQDAINEYTAVLREILDTEFFVEDTDFYYKNFQFEELKQWLVKGIWYFDKKYSELIYRPIGIAPVATSLDEDGAGDVGGGSGAMIDPRVLDEPNGEDSDGDGISDLDETDIFGTDPQLADTDGDGVNDGLENQNGLDPLFGAPEDKQQFDEMVAEFEASQVSGPSAPEDSVKENIIPLFWVYYPHAREILKKGQAFNNRNTSKYISFDDIINSRRFSSVIYKEENVYENREVKDYIKNNSFMRLLESERIKDKIRNFEHDMWSW
jgi:hypothetical protein